jgi:VIT1/CCC1 family predicted Fe2+/Mn2+ transporter
MASVELSSPMARGSADNKQENKTTAIEIDVNDGGQPHTPPKSRQEWLRKTSGADLDPNAPSSSTPEPNAASTGTLPGGGAGSDSQLLDKKEPIETDWLNYNDPNHSYREHQGAHRQYIRDMVLGANDGLVSVFLVILGLAGGGAPAKDVLLSGISAAVGGAISMSLGEYLATKSQAELYEGDLTLEQQHFKYHRQQEIDQVRAIFSNDLHLSGQLLDEVVESIGSKDTAMMNIMKAFEFGQNEQDHRSPWVAMLFSGLLFIVASLPAWLPFCFTSNITTALIASICLAVVAMFLIGAFKTLSTRGEWWFGGLENMLIGGAGGGMAYGVGALYDHFS